MDGFVSEASLDRRESLLSVRTRVVAARDVFVSRPDSGEPYARHPRAEVYEKGLQLLTDNPQRQYHFILKLMMLGDAGVGKSSYLLRLTETNFPITYMSTIGADFKVVYRGFCDPLLPLSMETPVGMKLQIWDTAGQERYRNMSSAYYRGSSGYFLFFDVSDRGSFESIPHWVSEMRRYGHQEAPAVLIGMKQDIAWPGGTVSPHPPSGGKDPATAGDDSGLYGLREQYRQVSFDEGLAIAQQFDMPYVECSAKDNVHIEDALATLVYHIVRSRADLQRGVQEDIFGRPLALPGDQQKESSTPEGEQLCNQQPRCVAS